MAPSIAMDNWADGIDHLRSPIAICGMALRLPGGISTPSQFWNFILDKKDAVAPIPESRFHAEHFISSSGKPGFIQAKNGYFLDIDIGALDTTFFSMPKNEVEKADPQQRVLLELTRECLDSAGEVNYRGKDIGTYIGSFGEDWADHFAKDPQNIGLYQVTGKGDFVLANRISYEYDLQGPSMTIRTACSSSLLALHEACLSLWTGGCSSALVGGCNLMFSPDMSIQMTQQGVLSPDASCKTFDEKANGYARAEAVNLIYIKPLQDAVRDGNPIRAVIKGAWTNADGKTAGISIPSSHSHESMIRRAYASAGISDFSQTAFVECHGTGTSAGDPIETKAIQSVFNSGVFIGSVKPNVGHSEGASGITSVIKSVLALENQIIPPNIKFTEPSRKIDFSNLWVPTESMLWPVDCSERVSVNSFGISGSNCHFILESARSMGVGTVPVTTDASFHRNLLLHSANTAESIKLSANLNEDFIRKNPLRLHDTAYTLGSRREHLPHRCFTVASPHSEPGVADLALESSPIAKAPATEPSVAMIFTGQGAQWPQMGLELFSTNPIFAASIRQMGKVLHSLPDGPTWSIQDELQKPTADSSLHLAAISQPLCTAIQVALVDALADLNVYPYAVVGHSSGEIAAAYASGRISAEEAIAAAYYRGVATSQATRSGSMGAIGMSRTDTLPFLQDGVAVACENSPSSVTISGDTAKVKDVLDTIFEAKGGSVSIRLLKVDKAYHSHHMKDVGNKYLSMMSSLPNGDSKPRLATSRMYSSVTGFQLRGTDLIGAEYWQSNLEYPVLFKSAVESLVSDAEKTGTNLIFLEVGPHGALAGPLRQILAQSSSKHPYTTCLTRANEADLTFLKAIGQLWQNGVRIDHDRLFNPDGDRRVILDLPSYPWHHEHSYIFDSRVSNQARFRKFRKHELLGLRTAESTDDEPVFRNLLVPDRVRWLGDHKIDGDVVFPCAGYLGTVGEAVRQCSDPEPGGYSVRNVTIGTAMVINGSKPVELVTSLRRQRLTDSLDGSWWDFTISSLTGSTWTKHCAGQVRAGSLNDKGLELVKNEKYLCSAEVGKWYEAFSNVGAGYGQAFQVLGDVECSTTTTACRATVSNASLEEEERYSIHPTTIDGFLQAFGVAAQKGISHKMTTLNVPTFIESMSIIDCSSAVTTRVEATLSSRGAVCGDAQGVSSRGSLVFTCKGVKLSPLGAGLYAAETDPHAAARVVWRPFVGTFDMSTLTDKSSQAIRHQEICRELSQLCAKLSLDRVLEVVGEEELSPHATRFLSWLKKQPLPTSVSTIEDLASQLHGTELEARVDACLKVLQNVVPLIRGEVQLLELLLEDSTLSRLYDDVSPRTTGPFFQALGHARPNMRIFEIGAGTGGTTKKLLEALTATQGSRMYSSYMYTDISPGFFTAAKERFRDYPNLEFRALDISIDPLLQGFDAESYDLVVASNVLHATPSLRATLSNVRKLLHTSGSLYKEELASEDKTLNYIMGLFPGWWLGEEDGRADEPYISPDRWDRELRGAGFAGLSTVAYDRPHPHQLGAAMMAQPYTQSITDGKVVILHDHDSAQIATELKKQLKQHDIVLHPLGHEPLPQASDLIAVIDLERPYLENMTQESFCAFRSLMEELSNKQTGCLWLTRSSQIECVDPRRSQTLGATRAIRRDLGFDLATCEIDRLHHTSWLAVGQVFEEFRARRQNNDSAPDLEYAVVDGTVHIPRLFPFSLSDELATTDADDTTTADAYLEIGQYGRLQTLHWASMPSVPALKDDEIIIDIKCTGMNFKDLLIAMGIVDAVTGIDEGTSKLGIEGVGVIRSIGAAVQDFNVGQRVMTMNSHGCFATRLTVPAKFCVAIPDSLSDEGAATMPCVFATVIYSLIDLGRLEANQSVLIHSAAGGVGIAAIQIAQMIGAEIYCTVSSEAKIQFLESNYGIQRDHIFNSRDDSFLPGLLAATAGRGVDIVLNSLSGELLHASWRCVAEFGKMIEIGKRDLIGHGALDLRPFLENRSYHGVDLSQFCAAKPEQCRRLLQEILRLYGEGHIKPLHPVKAFTEQEIEACFRYMQKGQHIGKMVMKMDSAQLPGIQTPTKQVILENAASYILVGGLGGLGRIVATWLVERGARHLIFLSRTAGQTEADQAFSEELQSQSCRTTFIAGNVTVLADVEKAIDAASNELRGVINMSMVLRDNRFDTMTHEQWTAAVEPKVRGTWNLHNACLSRKIDLNFFLLFSSTSGVLGQPGQANYAGANSFLDAFVQYRQGLGLKAAVIDVGAMLDHGYVAESQALKQQLAAQGHYGVRSTQLLDAITLAMSPSASARTADNAFSSNSQIIIGLRSTKSIQDPSNRVAWKDDRRFALYHNQNKLDSSPQDAKQNAITGFMQSLVSEPSILERPESAPYLAKQIALQLCTLLLKPMENEDEVDVSASLQDLGLDSLVAIELRSWWKAALGLDITVLEMLSSESLLALGQKAVSGLKEKLGASSLSLTNGSDGTAKMSVEEILTTKMP